MNYKNINCTLIITNIISVLLILQIIFGICPLNPFDFDDKKINDVNNLLLGFLLGYILNSLFYLFSTVIPTELNKKRVKKIVSPYLSDIYNRFRITELYFNSKFQTTNLEGISRQSLESFNTLSKSNLDFSYEENNNNNWTSTSYPTFTEIDFFEDEKDLILNNIEVILSNPFISGLDSNLVYTLTKIKTELFYIGVRRHIEFKNIQFPFQYKDFQKYAWEHIQLIKEFFEQTEYIKSDLDIKELR